MGNLIWDIYFYGTPLGALFGYMVILRPQDYKHPHTSMLSVFFLWPVVVITLVALAVKDYGSRSK